ncbi:MAG: hypothetical protein NTU73_06510, partial [Ignavibacteriae bacterium]|nr:hypothetical protein [Ignavibacteriota bacterium]
LKKSRKRFYKKINLNKSLQKYFGIITTFTLVSLAWMFFRINSLADSDFLVKNFFNFGKSINLVNLFNNHSDFYVALVSIAFLFTVEIIQTLREKNGKNFSVTNILSFPVVFILLISLFMFGKFEQHDFLYFRF